jgi:hypothetical protein
MELAQMQNTAQGSAASYQRAIDSIDRLANHPGLSAVVGANNPLAGDFGGWGAIPGTQASNFRAELDTLKAQTFLPMVQSLRGMGALSDAEGKKLTDAIGALNPKMSEVAFKESLGRIKADLQSAKQRADRLGGGQQQQPQADPLKIF